MAVLIREPSVIPICDVDLKIVYRKDLLGNEIAHYVRDRSGLLFKFREPSRYTGQDERYAREIKQVNDLADFLLDALTVTLKPDLEG